MLAIVMHTCLRPWFHHVSFPQEEEDGSAGGEDAAEEQAPKASPRGGFAALSHADGEPDEEEDTEDIASAEPNGLQGSCAPDKVAIAVALLPIGNLCHFQHFNCCVHWAGGAHHLC